MPKAYWIAHVDVHDNEIYAKYKEANAIAFAKYGARFVVRGGEQTIEECHPKPRTVGIEYENWETAQKCYLSEEYQKAKKIREPVSTGDLIIVEGYDGE